MSSNLPNNTSENDPEAPWNEKTKEISITAILTLDCTVLENQDESELKKEVFNELHRALYCTDFDVEDIIIEEN